MTGLVIYELGKKKLNVRKPKMKKLIPLFLTILFLNGCALPLTDQTHFDPELEKLERDLMIRKDFATGEERLLIEKDLDRIHNNCMFSSQDALDMLSSGEARSTTDKAIGEKITRELERASKDAQKLENATSPIPNTPLEPSR